MFQFPGFTSMNLFIQFTVYSVSYMSFLIRKSSDHRLFAPTRSLSQLIASFIGSWCHGIHHAPFVAWSLYYKGFNTDLRLYWYLLIIIFFYTVFKEHRGMLFYHLDSFESTGKWSLKIKQRRFRYSSWWRIQRTLLLHKTLVLCNDSLERRWSSRRFSYGYLVTTSPQSWITPWAAAPLRLAHRLLVQPTFVMWRAVCTRPGNVFTATCWFAITSNSGFM